MVSSNYVRVGRLVRVLRGPRTNQVAVISDIIDANRILVENPTESNMKRHVQNMKNIEPLKFMVKIGKNAKTAEIKAAMEKSTILAKWNKTTKAKKMAAGKALEESTDFERYQLRVAKRSRAHHARKIFEENDKKSAVSFERIALNKLERAHKKFGDKVNKQRHDRIKKFFTAKKAKKAGGKKAGKK